MASSSFPKSNPSCLKASAFAVASNFWLVCTLKQIKCILEACYLDFNLLWLNIFIENFKNACWANNKTEEEMGPQVNDVDEAGWRKNAKSIFFSKIHGHTPQLFIANTCCPKQVQLICHMSQILYKQCENAKWWRRRNAKTMRVNKASR